MRLTPLVTRLLALGVIVIAVFAGLLQLLPEQSFNPTITTEFVIEREERP